MGWVLYVGGAELANTSKKVGLGVSKTLLKSRLNFLEVSISKMSLVFPESINPASAKPGGQRNKRAVFTASLYQNTHAKHIEQVGEEGSGSLQSWYCWRSEATHWLCWGRTPPSRSGLSRDAPASIGRWQHSPGELGNLRAPAPCEQTQNACGGKVRPLEEFKRQKSARVCFLS